MSKEAMKLALEALKEIESLRGISSANFYARRALKAIEALAEQPAQLQPVRFKCTVIDDVHSEGVPLERWGKQPAQQQQEPVAVPTTSYEHRKFVLVGREWYERFAAFHDDCQIGEQLTWQEKTIRQQGYENGWNDAQRYLKEPQATSSTPAQRKPLTDEQIDALREKHSEGRGAGWRFDFKGFARAIEAAHGIKEKNT